MRFAAPKDRGVLLTTAISVLLLGGVTLAVLFAAGNALGPVESAIAWGVALLSLSVLAVSWALAPKGFSLEGSTLRVERPLRPVVVRLAEIREAALLPEGAVRGALRVGGSGGLFGLYGWFWNRTLGGFRMYASRSSGLVRVDTLAGRLVLSPEPPERFLETLLGRAPSAVRAEPGAPIARTSLPARAWGGLAAALALVALAVGGIVLASHAFAPARVAVDREEIRIERNAAPPVVVPLADVEEVRRLGRDEIGRLSRVSGYAGFGGCVAYGRFRSTKLGDFRLYSWRCGAWVLLETRGGRIALTPEDPDGFVAEVRAGMGR